MPNVRRREVVGKVRRNRRKAGRITIAVLLAAHRTRLVQNQRVRRRIGHNRDRTVVLDLNTPAPRWIAAVSLSPSASVTVCTTCSFGGVRRASASRCRRR